MTAGNNKKYGLESVVAGVALGILVFKLVPRFIKKKPSTFRNMIRRIKLIRSGRTMNQSYSTHVNLEKTV